MWNEDVGSLMHKPIALSLSKRCSYGLPAPRREKEQQLPFFQAAHNALANTS